MGSTGGAILFYCVALLSVVAVGSAAAPDGNNGRFISRVALSCSNVTESSHRKLQGGLPPGVCPVRFEGMPGIRTVTSSCRSVHFSAQRCCGAFKNFACPYAELLNDEDNGCASEMFFEIIVRGRLTPGLFSNLCHEGPAGLQCY